jgi:hypothetical protein
MRLRMQIPLMIGLLTVVMHPGAIGPSVTHAKDMPWLVLLLDEGEPGYPGAIGDLVFRDSEGRIYGRDGHSCSDAVEHPGHVGIYVGNDKVIHALGFFDGIEFVGEVMETPLTPSPGVRTFYSDQQGVVIHGPLGSKTHRKLLHNPNAKTLRENIVFLAKQQIGEGYDNDFHQQKGGGDDDWTCSGLAEKIYESCAGQTLIYHDDYGDNHLYAGGLDITPDGYEYHLAAFHCYFQSNVEFSQVPSSIFLGRWFGFPPQQFIFFPYTQFVQPTLIDSF